MLDTLYDSRRFRTLSVLDGGNRQALGIEVATSIPSQRAIRMMNQLIELHGRPKALRLDDGTELTSYALAEWELTLRLEGVSLALRYLLSPASERREQRQDQHELAPESAGGL